MLPPEYNSSKIFQGNDRKTKVKSRGITNWFVFFLIKVLKESYVLKNNPDNAKKVGTLNIGSISRAKPPESPYVWVRAIIKIVIPFAKSTNYIRFCSIMICH